LILYFFPNTFDLEWCSNCARPVLWCHKLRRVDSNSKKITTNNCV